MEKLKKEELKEILKKMIDEIDFEEVVLILNEPSKGGVASFLHGESITLYGMIEIAKQGLGSSPKVVDGFVNPFIQN